MRKTQTYQIEISATQITITRQKFIDPKVVELVPLGEGSSSLTAFNWAMHLILEEVARDRECPYEFKQVIQITPEISRVFFVSLPKVV